MDNSPNVRQDSTDHIAFFCDTCGLMCRVTKLETSIVLVRVKPKKKEKCTWIHLACPVHGQQGWRKFYHQPDESCTHHYTDR